VAANAASEVARVVGVSSEAVRRTLHGYTAFLPAIAVNWVMVELVAAQVDRAPAAAQAGLLLIGSVLYFAGAQRACGRTGVNPLQLALSRAGSCVDVLVAAAGILGVAALGVGLGALWSGEAGAVAGAAIGGTLALALASRLWPVVVVAFLDEGSSRWSPAARGRIWSGPCIGRAWRLTAHSSFLRDTAPVLAASILAIGGWALARAYLERGFVVNLVFYAAVLPFLSVTLTLQSLRLHGTEGSGLDQAGPS
jgi:hypothetical protein